MVKSIEEVLVGIQVRNNKRLDELEDRLDVANDQALRIAKIIGALMDRMGYSIPHIDDMIEGFDG